MANLSYHDPSTDPLPLHSPSHEAERARLEAATAEFLASGGQVDQVGFQMKEGPQAFVIDPKKTPVYAHLFAPPPVELKAKPARQLAAARITHDLKGAEPRRPKSSWPPRCWSRPACATPRSAPPWCWV